MVAQVPTKVLFREGLTVDQGMVDPIGDPSLGLLTAGLDPL